MRPQRFFSALEPILHCGGEAIRVLESLYFILLPGAGLRIPPGFFLPGTHRFVETDELTFTPSCVMTAGVPRASRARSAGFWCCVRFSRCGLVQRQSAPKLWLFRGRVSERHRGPCAVADRACQVRARSSRGLALRQWSQCRVATRIKPIV